MKRKRTVIAPEPNPVHPTRGQAELLDDLRTFGEQLQRLAARANHLATFRRDIPEAVALDYVGRVVLRFGNLVARARAGGAVLELVDEGFEEMPRLVLRPIAKVIDLGAFAAARRTSGE